MPASRLPQVSQPIKGKTEGKDFILLKSPDFGPSLTKQSFRDEVDINRIVANAVRTGMPPVGSRPAVGAGAPFGSVPPAADLKTALDFVRDSRARFFSLSSILQRRFGTPEALIDFISKPVNYQEALDLGLIAPVKALEAQRAAKAAGAPEGGAQPPKGSVEPNKGPVAPPAGGA